MGFKFLFLLIASLASVKAFAAQTIKLQDGSTASCKNTVDVFRSSQSLAYRPVKTRVRDSEVSLVLEFLRCVQTGSRFAFSRTTDISRTSVLNGVTIRYERSEPKVVVTRPDLRLIAEVPLNQAGSVFAATLPVSKKHADRDQQGRYFIEYSVRMHESVTNVHSGVEIYHADISMGPYRIFFSN